MEKMNFCEKHNTNEIKEEKKFIYRDNSDGGKIIFECNARNILDADKLYEEKTGMDPEKQFHIGCSIEKPKE